jgi:hypothetical protein
MFINTDFGTTYSGVAYSVINDYEQNLSKMNEYLFDVTSWLVYLIYDHSWIKLTTDPFN